MSVLRVGDRVREVKGGRLGVVRFRKDRGRFFSYMVRWDGNSHESGEYGEGALRRVSHPHLPAAHQQNDPSPTASAD